METKDKKYLISTYISFIAVIVSVITIFYSTYIFNKDFKLLNAFIAIFASVFGAFLFIFYKRITTQKYKSKIFISFAHEDYEFAAQIRKVLLNERFILNIDKENIKVGENIKQIILNEIKSSSIFIFLISKNSIKYQFVKNELEYAIENGKKILPVLIEKNVDIPEELKDIQFADFTENKEEAISKLIRALKHNLKE